MQLVAINFEIESKGIKYTWQLPSTSMLHIAERSPVWKQGFLTKVN